MPTALKQRSRRGINAILRHYRNSSDRQHGDVRQCIQRMLIDVICLLEQQRVPNPLAEITQLLHGAEDIYLHRSTPAWEVAKIRQYRQTATDIYASDTVEFDDHALVSISEYGAFVQAWVWVSKGQREEQTNDSQGHCYCDLG